MGTDNFTQWDHFNKNYKWTAIFMILAFIITLSMELIRESELWWISFFFLFIGIVVLPIGNYISWKKKFNDK